MRENKRINNLIFRSGKELPYHYSGAKEEKGYKAYGKNGVWLGFWTNEFRQNLKGGHRHNATRNALHRRVIRSKNARKTSRKNRMKWKQRGANG